MSDRILLFIPGYNCAKQIVRVLKQLDDNVLPYISEIIMVNNRSTDDTEAIVTEFIAGNPGVPLTLLRNDENYGLGGSHKVAFAYAVKHNFDYVIVLHGDDQGNIHDLLPLLKTTSYRSYDCCLGARFQNGSKLIGYSRFRTFGNRVYNMLFSLVAGKRIFDLGSGLNMYSTQMLKNTFYLKFPDNLTFNYCMVLAASYYKHNLMFFPISWRENDQVSNVKLFNQAYKVLVMLAKYGLDKQFITSEFRDKPIVNYTAQIIAQYDKDG